MVRRILITVSVIVVAFAAIYGSLLLDVMPVTDRGRMVLEGTISPDVAVEEALKTYDMEWRDPTLAEVDFKVLFALHDFRDGLVVVQYSCKGEDRDGFSLGSYHVNNTWRIHKEDGAWRVVYVYGRP
jgi:hypothetical protein